MRFSGVSAARSGPGVKIARFEADSGLTGGDSDLQSIETHQISWCVRQSAQIVDDKGLPVPQFVSAQR